MRTSWVVIVSLALLILMQPIMLLAAAYFRITSSFQSSAELASVMGAIFTAGGLIVALVSLYTLANVDKVVQEGVTTSLRTIPQQLDERIRTFLDAYTSFREAQDLWTTRGFAALAEIEELLLRAEEIEPTLRNLRRWGGLLFFQAARASYLREYVRDGVYQNCPQRMERPALAVKALQRLEAEFRHGPADGSAMIGACIAELFALIGENPSAIVRWVGRARERGTLPPIDGVNAITLVAGCRNEADVGRILAEYGQSAMSDEDIRTVLNARADGAIQSFVVFVKAAGALQNPPMNPTIATLRSVDHWNSAFIGWAAHSQPQIGTIRGGIPSFPEFSIQRGDQGNPPYSPLDALIRSAMEQFVFIAPFDFEEFLIV